MSFEASAARRNITPPQEWIDAGLIWLWGYGDRSAPCSGVADPLDAPRCASGTTTVAPPC